MTHALPWLTARPITHRGLHNREAGIIENCRSAFAAAIARNYAIECDLQISRDGEAILFHDDTLDRVMLGSGPLRDYDVAGLKQIAYKGGSDRMQTLPELLEQVAGRVPLVIEFKPHWDGDERLVRRTLDCLASYGGPYGLMSFDPDVIAALRRLAPEIPRGIVADRAFDPAYDFLPLARRIALRTMAHLPETAPHFVSFYHADLPFAPVHELRQAGHPVITWTIRSPAAAAIALKYCDQITFEGFTA